MVVAPNSSPTRTTVTSINRSSPAANVTTVYTAAAYKFTLKGVLNSIEPQVSVRGIKNDTSIVDAGINLIMFRHILDIYGMFHSSGAYSTGVGLHYKDILYIQGSYLSKMKGLEDYTDGNFEVYLALSLFRK